MTGPKSNLWQMLFNYLYNIFSSVFFALTVGKYLSDSGSFLAIGVEVLLNFLCLCASLTCSFADPGIVTLKSQIIPQDEELSLPEGSVVSGSEFYMFVEQEALLQHVLAGKTTEGFALQVLRQLRQGF